MIRGITAVHLTHRLIDKKTCSAEEIRRYRGLLTDQDMVLKPVRHKGASVQVMFLQKQLYPTPLAICINDADFLVCFHTDGCVPAYYEKG